MDQVVYSPRIAYPQYLERARTQQAALEVYRDRELVAPLSGTYTLLAADDTVIANAEAVTIEDGRATFEVDASLLPESLSLGYGWREIWDLQMPAGGRRYVRDAALVLQRIYPVITDQDLEDVYTDLARLRGAGKASYQDKIDEAWKRILSRLEGAGNFPNLIMTPWSLRELHLELTLHLVASDFRSGRESKWDSLAHDHKREFELGWKRLRVRYDDRQSGRVGRDLRPVERGTVFGGRAPSRTWRGIG